MPWLEDPDKRRQRWPDRDERDWAGIAAVVQHVIDEVAERLGRTEQVDEDDPDMGKSVVVDVELGHLEAQDQKIAREWFRPGVGPLGDPWDGLSDGRHRLWNCWQAAPDAVLPVYSSHLHSLDQVQEMSEDSAARLYEDVRDGIELSSPSAVSRSPRFYAELGRVASLGGYDDLIPSRRYSARDHNVPEWDEDDPYDDDDDDDDDSLQVPGSYSLPPKPVGLPVRRPALPPRKQQGVAPVHAPPPWWRRVLTWLAGR